MDNEETAQALQFLQDTWTQRPMARNAARIWGIELARFEHADVMRALLDLARTSEWRPSLATIIKALAAPEQEQASAAFAAVMGSFSLPVGQRGHRLSSATRETVRRLGGWEALGRWEKDERHWRERDFIRVYGEVCESREADAVKSLPANPAVRGLASELAKASRREIDGPESAEGAKEQ